MGGGKGTGQMGTKRFPQDVTPLRRAVVPGLTTGDSQPNRKCATTAPGSVLESTLVYGGGVCVEEVCVEKGGMKIREACVDIHAFSNPAPICPRL